MQLLIEYQYFGNVNLYKSLYKNKYIIFEQCENYQKSSFRNKMVLASPTGKQMLGIPILGGRGVKMKIDTVCMDNRVKWQINHIKTIINLYNRSPWFEYYKESLESLYRQQYEKLVDWNLSCIKWALTKLKLDAILSQTESFCFKYDTNHIQDLRDFKIGKSSNPELIEGQYNQLFIDKTGFLPNISILDLLFCEGPNALQVLKSS